MKNSSRIPGIPSVWIFVAFPLFILLNGCGTTVGILDEGFESKIYVGVLVDVKTIGGDGPGTCANQNLLPFALIDLPLSIALDTVFLPGTLLYEVFRPP